jgi:flagellar hook-length control protein FliK
MAVMDFGIPDLSTGRDPGSDPTRRRDKAAGSDFAAMLDQSMETPEEAPRERDPVKTSEPAPAEKVREKPRHTDSAERGQNRAEDDPSELAPEAAAQETGEPSSAEAKQAAADSTSTPVETKTAETDTVAAEPTDQAAAPAPQTPAAQPAAAAETKAPKAAPVDSLAALAAAPQPTPANSAAGDEALPNNAAKAADATTTQPAFAAQLANAAGQPAEATTKSKTKTDTAPAGETAAAPVAVETATAAAVAAAAGTNSDNRAQNDASNGKPAQQQAAPTIAAPAQPTQNTAAPSPVPAADPAATSDDVAQIVAIVRAPTQQATTQQPAAPEANTALPSADKLPKDVAGEAKVTAEPAKSDTPRPFGALAPGLGVAAQMTAQQTPEQASAAERLAQLAAAVDEKVVPATKGDVELAAPKDAAATALRTDQLPAVDAPVSRHAATDVDAAVATARTARPTYHPVVTQVAAQVAQAAADGTDRINIRLSPAELGRIDVKLDFGPDGRVQAVFAAERPQTMELLQRDARDLERALQDAGLRADSGSLSFNLRGNGRDNRDDQAPGGHHKDGGPADMPASQLQAYAAGQGGQGRLDIRI